MNLMDASLTQGISLEMLKVKQDKARRKYVAYEGDGYQATLNAMVFNFKDMLRIEHGKPDLVNLDDPIVWRQKRVKAQALQFFSILTGQSTEANFLRIAFDELCKGKGLTTGEKGSLKKRYLEAGYSAATTKAQVSQMISLFTNLRIIIKKRPYEYVINPVSLLFEKAVQAFGTRNNNARSVSKTHLQTLCARECPGTPEPHEERPSGIGNADKHHSEGGDRCRVPEGDEADRWRGPTRC